MSDYPAAERQNCGYAIRYIRWLFTSGAANEVGPDAAALLCAVVSLEDEFFYERPPNFFNQQLMNRCGMLSEHAFIRARQLAVGAGLLFYAPGAKRRPGKYFVLGFTAQNAAKAGRKPGESQEKARPSKPHPPSPKPNKAASLFDEVAFQEFWDAYPNRDGKPKGNRKLTEQAFAKVSPADHSDLMKAVANLKASGQYPKDAERFFKNDEWRKWVDIPAAVDDEHDEYADFPGAKK